MSQKETPEKGRQTGNPADNRDKSKRTDREERLAAALRDNLRRRKAQARGRRDAEAGSGGPISGESGGNA